MSTSYYYDSTKSTKIALDLALKRWFAKVFFSGDVDGGLSRVIYASNAYCFRRRLELLRKGKSDETQLDNNLQLPFLNFYENDEPHNPTDLGWKSAKMIKDGMFIDELGTKVKIAPVDYAYEATAFFATVRDKDAAYQELSWVAQYPIMLDDLELMWNNVDTGNDIVFPLPNYVTFQPSYNPVFNEQDWLEKERIASFSLNFNVQTFRLRAVDKTVGNFWVPTKVLLNVSSEGGYEEQLQLTIDHVLGETYRA